MSWDSLTAISELISAVAVVISLVYVGVQIRQSNQISRAGTFQSINNQFTNIWSMIANSEDLAQFHSRVKRAEPLDTEDFERYCGFVISYLAWLEDLYIQQQSGMFAVELGGEDAIEFMAPQFKAFICSPQVRAWLIGPGRAGFSPDYYSRISEYLREGEV